MKTLKNTRTIWCFLFLFIFSAQVQAQSFEVLNADNSVEQGEVLIIRIAPQWQVPAVINPSISVFGGHYLPNKYGEIFIGVGLDAKPRKHIATLVEYGRGVRLSWDHEEVEIVQKNFPTRIRGPFTPTPKWNREKADIKKAFDGGDYDEKYFDDEFVRPLDIVAQASGRVIGETSYPFGNGHNGVDLITRDPATGKYQRPVKAINSGKVILIARNYSTEGNMVIIDHGSGIFSVYMHLSGFSVSKVGQVVKKGDIIAMSGDTGGAKNRPSCRSCGPHLHFSVKVRTKDGKSDVYVDPLGFIERVNQYLK